MEMSTTNIISVFYQTLLFAIGVPGNLLIILTYCRRQQRTSSGVFIIALALADLGICLMSPAVIYNYVIYYDYPSDAFCKFRYYTNHGLIYVSRFLTIAVAVERYLAVCQPLAKRIQPKGAVILAALCVPLGYLLTIPIAMAFRTQDIPGDRTICFPYTSDNLAVEWILKVSFPITFLGGLSIVVVCYTLIYRVIKKQMNIRAQMMTGPGKSNGGITVISDPTTNSSETKTGQTSFVYGSKSEISYIETTNANSHAEISDVCVKVIPDSESKTETQADEKSAKSDDDVEKATRRKKKQNGESKSNSMDSTTKMLLIVTIIYFMSFIPQFITVILPTSVMSSFKVNFKIGYEIFIFVRRLITINHIVNPFVYGFVNRRFRQDCLATLKWLGAKLCGCCSKN